MSATDRPVRVDLLELTTEALTVMANVGLVKRATREADSAAAPTITTRADGTVEATFPDGTVTSIGVDVPLRDSECSCPATICRHRVALVLAYQRAAAHDHADGTRAEPGPSGAASVGLRPAEADDLEPDAWTPAGLDLSSIKPATLAAAQRLVAARPVVTVRAARPGRAASAKLPMTEVVFLTRSIANARCDCLVGYGCEHVVVAVWAFQQAQTQGLATPGVREPATLEVDRPGLAVDGLQTSQPVIDPSVRADLVAFATRLWWDGSAQPAIGYERDLARLRHRVAGWTWVAAALERVVDLMHAQRTRSTRFDPHELLVAVSELTVRLDAAEHAVQVASAAAVPRLPARTILGVGVPGEVVLDRQLLVSLGGRSWSSDEGVGVQVWLADIDTMAVGVLERHWPGGGLGPLQRRVAGATVGQLLASQVLVHRAKRRASGQVELPRTAQVTALSATTWGLLRPPLSMTADEIVDQLRAAAPPAVAVPHSALHVLPMDGSVDEWGYDAAAQQLVLTAGSGGRPVRVIVTHDALSPHAVDAAAVVADAGRLTTVVGEVAVIEGELSVRATALASPGRALVLAAAAAPPTTVTDWPVAQRRPPGVVPATLDLLAQCLRQGIRSLGQPGRDRLAERAIELRDHGLVTAANWLADVTRGMSGQDRSAVTVRLHQTVSLLLQLSVATHPGAAAAGEEPKS